MPSAIETALARFNQGSLDEAIGLAREALRASPDDVPLRVVLAEFQCFQGEYEKADQQLNIASDFDPSLAVGVGQFRHIVHAAAARRDFYTRGRLPEFLVQPSEEIKHRLRAAVALQAGQAAEAVEELGRADAMYVSPHGECDGQAFQQFRDLDDLLASVLEVLMADGKYFWVPFNEVQSLEFERPRRPRDLLFREARLQIRDGKDGTVFIPVLYDGSSESADLRIRLGRSTDWSQAEGAPVRGLGQRMWLAGDCEAAILDTGRIRFDGENHAP